MLSALLAFAVAAGSADTMPVVPAASAAATPLASAMARPRRFTADSLVLDKSERLLRVYQHGKMVLTYSVALGSNPVGRKVRRGDGRTPEGLYYIDGRNAQSKYHLALRISYPNAADRARALRNGVSPGGDIMIHGLPKSVATIGALHRQQDWTEGCVAITNEEIEELWRNVADGARILIKP
jgi:murein L,D-transpeptidase YafK